MLGSHEQRLTALLEACRQEGVRLNGCVTHRTKPVDGATLLWAIAGSETNFGLKSEYVREEKAYMPGGYYYRNAGYIRTEQARWGVLACSSFGAFQIMYPLAYELGYREHPVLLQNDKICAKWAADAILKRFVRQGCLTLTDLFDAYNTGSSRDMNVPEAYIAKGIGFYEAGLPTLTTQV
jgi:hypothetical protein